MKLPSIQYLLTSAKASLRRFPWTVLSSLVAVVIGIYTIEKGDDFKQYIPLFNIILCASIGIPLYFSATIFSETKRFDKTGYWLTHLIATGLLLAIYFTLPSEVSQNIRSTPYVKYALYNIASHLLAAFIPFIFSRELNAFWHYNKILFIRFLASMLYSGFIYTGLLIALTAVNLLFDIKIHEKLYIEIYIVTLCFFNTWFFVSGIPAQFSHLEENLDYPKGLKTFAQYVLLPLLALYLIILYTYGTKIVISWDWPRGIVSYLIIFVSVLGIFAYLLLHPYGNQLENVWIKWSSRAYYFLLIPLLILLYIAIFMRINDYGITVSRYAILALGIWLSIVCLYTALGFTNIKFIPTSLFMVIVLSSFGPWGMYSVSERSQATRLERILTEAKILVNQKVQREVIWNRDSLPKLIAKNEFSNQAFLTDSLGNEVKSILDYLDSHHGYSSIRSWFSQDLLFAHRSNKHNGEDEIYLNEAEIIMRSLGLKYESIAKSDKTKRITFKSNRDENIKTISNYDYLVQFEKFYFPANNSDELEICHFKLDSLEYTLRYEGPSSMNLLLCNERDTLPFALIACIEQLKKKHGNHPSSEIPRSEMELIQSNIKWEVKMEFHSIELEYEKQKLTHSNISGDIFIKRK